MASFNRARCCVFTINNPTEADESTLLEQVDQLVEYVIMGDEVGETGTHHIQGYCQFTKPLSLSAVKKLLPRAHIENVKGTQKQAIDYCKKDGHFDEYGKLKKHGGGKRKVNEKCATIKKRIVEDRESLQKVVLDCENPTQVHFAQFMEKYSGLDHALRSDLQVFWYYGPTGCGKSHTVFGLVNPKSYWKSSIDLKWFDGYCGQEDVWIDDFRGSHCSFNFLLQLLDIYPLMVPVKGSFVRWSPRRIFITCPFKPQDCYAGVEDKSQLIRRITLIQHFNIRYNPGGDDQSTQEIVEDEIPEVAPEDDPNYAYLNGL